MHHRRLKKVSLICGLVMMMLTVAFWALGAPPETASNALKRIKARGELRVLSLTPPPLRGLVRDQTSWQRELALLQGLADAMQVRLKIIYYNNMAALIPLLLDGQGDLIAANMTITAQRRRWIDFSLPIAAVTEQLVVNREAQINSLSGLRGKTVTFERGTSYYLSLLQLQKQYPKLKLKFSASRFDTEELLEQVGDNRLTCVIADSNYVATYRHYRDAVKVVYKFSPQSHIGWGIAKDNSVLLRFIDNYLRQSLPRYASRQFVGDLPQINKRRIIRILTRNNPRDYFVHRGKLMGFEYELARKFAAQHGLQVVMVVPPRWDDLIPWLKAGYGDIVAASLTVTHAREAIPGVTFASRYGSCYEVIVTRSNDDRLHKIFDLRGRTLVVRQGSSYWEVLHQLQQKDLGFKLLAAPNNMESEEILAKVASGEYDLTLVDENIFNLVRHSQAGLKVAMRIGAPISYGWLVRSDNRQLARAVGNFFKREYRGTFYNLLYRRYYLNKGSVSRHQQDFTTTDKLHQVISRFDAYIKKYAAMHKFPWCLIAAQIYQESRFNPEIRAWDGGMGLMQLMPRTAREQKCRNPYNPEENIRAGVGYLAQLRNRVSRTVSEDNRISFALASYNGGYGHLRDARKLAAEEGLNADIWRNNVEKAYHLLRLSRYASRARYGSCRGDIITRYVNDILIRFQNYQLIVKHWCAKHSKSTK